MGREYEPISPRVNWNRRSHDDYANCTLLEGEGTWTFGEADLAGRKGDDVGKIFTRGVCTVSLQGNGSTLNFDTPIALSGSLLPTGLTKLSMASRKQCCADPGASEITLDKSYQEGCAKLGNCDTLGLRTLTKTNYVFNTLAATETCDSIKGAKSSETTCPATAHCCTVDGLPQSAYSGVVDHICTNFDEMDAACHHYKSRGLRSSQARADLLLERLLDVSNGADCKKTFAHLGKVTRTNDLTASPTYTPTTVDPTPAGNGEITPSPTPAGNGGMGGGNGENGPRGDDDSDEIKVVVHQTSLQVAAWLIFAALFGILLVLSLFLRLKWKEGKAPAMSLKMPARNTRGGEEQPAQVELGAKRFVTPDSPSVSYDRFAGRGNATTV